MFGVKKDVAPPDPKKEYKMLEESIVKEKHLQDELATLKKEFSEQLKKVNAEQNMKLNTLLDAMVSIIELLEEKEVFTEEELDSTFKNMAPESFDRLKNIYAEYNADPSELVKLGFSDNKKSTNESESGEKNA